MVAEGGESTFSTTDGGESIAPPGAEREIQSIFRKLTTSELLKHLLSARGRHDGAGAGDVAKKRGHDSSQEEQTRATDTSPVKRTVCSKSACDKCDPADNNCDAICPTGRGYVSFEHGMMNEGDDDRESHASFRENLRRDLSEESAQPEQFSDEEITDFSKAILSSDTLDFILSGTEKSLCIQTPSPKETTSECTVGSDFSDFTELLPFVAESGSPEAAFSPVASTSGVAKVGTKTAPKTGGNSEKTDAASSDSDQDVNDAMVLVPSGEFFTFISQVQRDLLDIKYVCSKLKKVYTKYIYRVFPLGINCTFQNQNVL